MPSSVVIRCANTTYTKVQYAVLVIMILSAHIYMPTPKRCQPRTQKNAARTSALSKPVSHLAKSPAENHHPVLRVTSAGIICYANAAAAPLLKLWKSGVGLPLKNGVRQFMKEAIASGNPTTLDVDCGEQIYSLILVPILEDGYVTFYGRDITAQKEAEALLALMKHSIDTHFVLVCWFDSNNKIIYANNAACQTLGYRREEVLNRTLSEIDSTATNQILKKMRTQLRRNGHLITESRLRRKSGSEFPVEISVSHVQFGGKEYHCGVAHDITELSDIRQRLTTLTGREREVLEQIVTGRLNKQIAPVLDITEGTVKFHRGAVMKKMKVRSVAELVHLVSRGGIAPPQRI